MTTPDRGTTIRPSSTALFTIDSGDRFPTLNQEVLGTSSPYNFTIAGSRTLIPGFATRLACTEIRFPWFIPNVIGGQSDQIRVVFLQGGVYSAVDVVLQAGFYTPFLLALAIQEQVQVDFPNFTMTYGTIGTGAGIARSPQFQYATNVPGQQVAFAPGLYPSTVNYRRLFEIMGFKVDPLALTPPSPAPPLPPLPYATTGFYAFGQSGMTFCQNVRYVDIVSPQLTQNQGMPDSTTFRIPRDAIVRLYLGDSTSNTQAVTDENFCPPGCSPFIIYREFPYPKQLRWNAEQNIGSYITFQVYDDMGNLLDLDFADIQNNIAGSFAMLAGNDWNMSLLVTEN